MVNLVDEYQRQLRVLDQMLQESQSVRARFDVARQTYQSQINSARNMGYMGDYVDQLTTRFREFSDLMDQLLLTMLRGEVNIADQEQRLRRAIRDAQSTD